MRSSLQRANGFGHCPSRTCLSWTKRFRRRGSTRSSCVASYSMFCRRVSRGFVTSDSWRIVGARGPRRLDAKWGFPSYVCYAGSRHVDPGTGCHEQLRCASSLTTVICVGHVAASGRASHMIDVALVVNGEAVQRTVDERLSLIRFLRGDPGLCGTKE